MKEQAAGSTQQAAGTMILKDFLPAANCLLPAD
jgi:hypothetical protein